MPEALKNSLSIIYSKIKKLLASLNCAEMNEKCSIMNNKEALLYPYCILPVSEISA